MTLRVDIIPGPGNTALDAFVAASPDALIYTTTDYIRLVAGETRSDASWITVVDENGMRAALPVLTKIGSLGPVVNSLAYYGSNGGIVCDAKDVEAKHAAAAAFMSYCDDLGAAASTLITNPLLDDHDFYQTRLSHDLVDQRVGQFTVFPADRTADSLMSMFEDPRPRNIRKAERSGIEVSVSKSVADITFLSETHQQNIAAIGGLPKRREFFEALATTLPESAWCIYVARQGDETIAALLLLYFNGTVEYFTPCIVQEHRSSQALPLLIYRAMLDAMAEGYSRWNWGGTWLSQDGVYAFKKKWGTMDIPYHYFTRLRDRSLLKATRAQLLAEYAGLFVLPFSALATAN
jgi:hypothetical protein